MSGNYSAFPRIVETVKYSAELPPESHLSNMANELRKRGYTEAAEATEFIRDEYRSLVKKAEKLCDIWKAVDMVCCGDWSEPAIHEANMRREAL